jgi:hypothetical protein
LVVEDGVDRSGAEVPTSQRMSAAIPSGLHRVWWHEHLFTEERDPSIVNGIFGNDIQDASIFLR